MESVAARLAIPDRRLLRRIDVSAVSIWVLTIAVVLYLAFDGGGYDIVVRSQVGVIVWWIVLIAAAGGLIPTGRLTRIALCVLVLFVCFVAWTAVAVTWSQSSERSLAELSRVACYLGILLLAVGIHRDRARAIRHTSNALAVAIAAVALLAVISRLQPGLFPSAQQTSAFLPGTSRRLSWPLNYWNALAALVAFGLPLLLGVASSARRLSTQAAAAAGIPILVLCGYLTFSRGGAIAAAAAVLAFLALSPARIPKLATGLVAAAGSAALIAGVGSHHAIERGFTNTAAKHQGGTLLVALIVVSLGVGLVQAGIGLAVRHGTPPRLLIVSRRRARLLSAIALASCLAVALLAGAPRFLSHAWRDFKHPTAPGLSQDTISRFGKASGNGRYDYWKVATNATTGRYLLTGRGPGTYQEIWLPRAPYDSYVQNAHSLYFETFSELGIIGIALLGAFLAVVLAGAVRVVIRTSYETRVRASAAAASLIAFCVSAAVDWIWQVPVLPAAFLLLAAAVLAPRRHSEAEPGRTTHVARIAMVAAAIASLIAIAVPLASATAVRSSQSASARGDQALALADARAAMRVEPSAASPAIQAALVLEVQGRLPAALSAARRAIRDEPANWSNWLVLSRIQAERGQSAAAVNSFEQARTLNPRSPLFRP